jgi:hypothetical protein
VAFREPASGEQSAADNAVALDCELSVLRAGGLKTAGTGHPAGCVKERGEHLAVNGNQRTDQCPALPIRSVLAGFHEFALEPDNGVTPLAIAD